MNEFDEWERRRASRTPCVTIQQMDGVSDHHQGGQRSIAPLLYACRLLSRLDHHHHQLQRPRVSTSRDSKMQSNQRLDGNSCSLGPTRRSNRRSLSLRRVVAGILNGRFMGNRSLRQKKKEIPSTVLTGRKNSVETESI